MGECIILTATVCAEIITDVLKNNITALYTTDINSKENNLLKLRICFFFIAIKAKNEPKKTTEMITNKKDSKNMF